MLKNFTILKKSRLLLLTAFALITGSGSAWAETKTTDLSSLPDGWSVVGATHGSDRAKAGNAVYTSAKDAKSNYLLTEEIEGSLSFYWRSFGTSSSYPDGQVILYKYEGSAVGDQIAATTTMKSSTWTAVTLSLGDYKGQVAIGLYSACIDDITYTEMEAISGPSFVVKDGSTKLTSPYAYSFGLATAGTTKVFTLSNPGTEATPISINTSGANGFTAVVKDNATSIPAGEEKTLTITMPSATASGSIVVTPTGAGLSAFTFNVSGTVRDANKVYLDFADGQIPDGWTSVQIGSYGSAWTASTGYISQSGSSSSYAWAFTSPKLNFTNGELIAFETAKYSSSTWYTPSVTVEYSLDGTSWTAIGSAYTDDTYGTWTSRSVNIPVDGVKYIRFNGWYVNLRNIYGGELPLEPKMVVTQPASLDFGLFDKDETPAPTKTFTIANTGRATLSGITVSSDNAAFTITNAPTTLAAGASQDVTITMATGTTGALSSLITVSATDMTDATFTVTGAVMNAGAMVVDFNDNALPAGWGNNASYKWSFGDGKAYATYAAELTTPKLQFADGDFLVIKTTSYDDYDNNYIEITGSADGISWDAFTAKKYISRSEIPYGSYANLVVSGIPTTTKYLKIKGYYVRIDEIVGLTYAPVLSVTKDAAAVATPAAYDFGECGADATVTYSFANTGAGTINITNVAITGEGATAYSTNWTTSTVAPFNLVITRTYDAGRAGSGAMEAVVTVTTSEGDFVINVTGTDKAANDPELAVTPNEDAVFGVVTAATSKTYTVTNAGTGALTVNIASDDAKFTVSAAQLADIAAGESKTFDVIFTPVAETYGEFNANITVTPTYDMEAVVTIAASAKVKDPAIWSEDFTGNTKPTGWDAGDNWSFANGVAKASYAYGTTNYLTTPTLTVSGATDELTFDYKASSNYVSVKIQQSKDGAAFSDLYTISGLNNGDEGTYTITGLEAGDYQFRFANDDYQLDNFEGFKLNLADHICIISASSIPSSPSYSMTMKEGQSFDATVTVTESRGVNEDLTAKVYMGSTVIGTATGSVVANGTETLTITATPNAGAPDGVEMHIEVEYAGGTLSTKPETRYVAAITYLTLDETSSAAIDAGTYDNVTLKRQFAAGWNTVCLPFTISDVEGFFGTGAKAYNFSVYAGGTLSFSNVTTLSASYPYIVYVPAAITEDKNLTDITIDATASNRYQSGVYFRGTYAPIAAGGWTKTVDTDIIYVLSNADNKLMKAGSSASMKGFRAYFDVPASAGARLTIVLDDEVSGIATIENGELQMENVYNLQGQKVNNVNRKGLYIVNGKKTVIR